MATINKTRTPSGTAQPHLNWMGGTSYTASPITTLRMAAASCFFGEPQYYHESDPRMRRDTVSPPLFLSESAIQHLRETLNARDPQEWRGMSPQRIMESAIDRALDYSPVETLALAAELRQKYYIRVTPQVILVRAAHHPDVKGTGLIRRYASQIIGRIDECATGLAYHFAYKGDDPIPNNLKRAWKDVLESASEYQLAKYRLESRAVRLQDVVNLVHAYSPAIDKLMKGKLRVTDKTWEAIISAEGSTRESWEKALPVMGQFALLRNLRNLLNVGVDPAKFARKLVDGAPNAKILPFRYFSAWAAIRKFAPGMVLDALEEAMTASLGELPYFSGRTMSLCDNSGSAWGAVTSELGTFAIAEMANLMAIITGMVSDDGYIGIFGDKLLTRPVRKKGSIFEQWEGACTESRKVGRETENGVWLFFDRAIRNREHWDNIFIYSDMQAGHGGLYGVKPADYRDYIWKHHPRHRDHYIDVAKLVRTYRENVNPKVNVYLVQIAGYTDVLIPEFYERTYILGGWSAELLRFAAEMNRLADEVTQQ